MIKNLQPTVVLNTLKREGNSLNNPVSGTALGTRIGWTARFEPIPERAHSEAIKAHYWDWLCWGREAASYNARLLQGRLLAVFAYLKPRNQAESAKSFHQACETPAIFLAHRREFQTQSATGLHMAYNSFGPDLSFFDKKMNVCLRAHGP